MTKILICPLNWGLGHESRCIPIINKIKEKGNEVILASDGDALLFLKKEFPDLKTLNLSSYKIKYAKKGKLLKWKLLLSIPKIALAVFREKKQINKWIAEYEIDAIVSDNRLGWYSNQIPSIYITHQINVLTGNATKLSSGVHQYFIKKIDQCWIPDHEKEPSWAGKMSHTKIAGLKTIYIGVLS